MNTKHERQLTEPKVYRQPYRSIPQREEDAMILTRSPKGGIIELPEGYMHPPVSKL